MKCIYLWMVILHACMTTWTSTMAFRVCARSISSYFYKMYAYYGIVDMLLKLMQVHICYMCMLVVQMDTCKFAWVRIRVWLHDLYICLCSIYNLSPTCLCSMGDDFEWSWTTNLEGYTCSCGSLRQRANWDTSFHRRHLQGFEAKLRQLTLFYFFSFAVYL